MKQLNDCLFVFIPYKTILSYFFFHRENSVAQNFLKHQLYLRLSKHSFDLLLSFLQEKRLMLILSLINTHLEIDVYPGPPRQSTMQQELSERNVMLNFLHQQAKEQPRVVHWALSAKDPYYPRSLRQMQELNDLQSDDEEEKDDTEAKEHEEVFIEIIMICEIYHNDL
jgi:hypothetical protein